VTYRYKTGWNLRHILLLVAAMPILALIGFLTNLGIYKTMLFYLVVVVANVLIWLFTLYGRPNSFSLADDSLTIGYYFKPPVSLFWNEVTGVDHLGVHASKNGFGASELEIRSNDSRFYVVKHLIDYEDFEKILFTQLPSEAQLGPDPIFKQKDQKTNTKGLFICTFIGILSYVFKDSIPIYAGINFSEVLITGSIAGAATALLTIVGVIGKDKKA
jgi:hypothetical protein